MFFNELYLLVTQTVNAHVETPSADGPRRFEEPDFVKGLMAIFAQFYFAGV